MAQDAGLDSSLLTILGRSMLQKADYECEQLGVMSRCGNGGFGLVSTPQADIVLDLISRLKLGSHPFLLEPDLELNIHVRVD